MKLLNLVSLSCQGPRTVQLDELVSHVMTLGTFDPVFQDSQLLMTMLISL